MDRQEIKDLLEKARFELPVISTNIPTRKLIGESLDLLEQQPTASKFTKTIRHNLRIQGRAGDTHRLGNIYAELLKKACDRLDTAEATNKELKATDKTHLSAFNGLQERYLQLESRIKGLLEALEEADRDFYYIHQHPEDAHTDSYNFMEKVKQASNQRGIDKEK